MSKEPFTKGSSALYIIYKTSCRMAHFLPAPGKCSNMHQEVRESFHSFVIAPSKFKPLATAGRETRAQSMTRQRQCPSLATLEYNRSLEILAQKQKSIIGTPRATTADCWERVGSPSIFIFILIIN